MDVNGLPVYPEARPIGEGDITLLVSAWRSAYFPPSDTSPANIFGWRCAYDYNISRWGDSIVISGRYRGRKFVFPPLGSKNEVVDVVRWLFDKEKDLILPCAPLWLAKEMVGLGFKIASDRANWDYVYRSDALANLSGEKYHAKRNLIKQFVRNYSAQVEDLTEKVCKEAIRFSDKWCVQRDCEKDESLKMERCAVQEMLRSAPSLGLSGIAVKIDGEICAIAVGEEASPDTYLVHVEKGNHQYRGIYQFINQKLAERVAPLYRWINREQDLGRDGLRRAKLSYHPSRMEKKFLISL